MFHGVVGWDYKKGLTPNMKIGENPMRKIRAIFVVFAFFPLMACKTTTNLNTDPHYAGFVGKDFKTKIDLAVVKNDDDKKIYHLYFLGKNGVPEVEKMKSFPFNDYDRTIYGILPKGSILKIKKIQRVRSIEWNMVDYFAVVESTGSFNGNVVDMTFLTDMMFSEVSKPNPKYVEEISSPK